MNFQAVVLDARPTRRSSSPPVSRSPPSVFEKRGDGLERLAERRGVGDALVEVEVGLDDLLDQSG